MPSFTVVPGDQLAADGLTLVVAIGGDNFTGSDTRRSLEAEPTREPVTPEAGSCRLASEVSDAVVRDPEWAGF